MDDYHARFTAEMHAHSTGSGGASEPGDSLPTAMAERFYLAQCVKDETMAESIVMAKHAAPIAPESGIADFVLFTKRPSR